MSNEKSTIVQYWPEIKDDLIILLKDLDGWLKQTIEREYFNTAEGSQVQTDTKHLKYITGIYKDCKQALEKSKG